MELLTTSTNYAISYEYESVMLKIKDTGKSIRIGDFYGDPQMAIISSNEEFCAMCGFGVIIYFLREPFEEYQYGKETPQWKEWGRSKGGEIWVDTLKLISENIIEITTEDRETINLDIAELNI